MLFHPHVYQKHPNNITQIPLPNTPLESQKLFIILFANQTIKNNFRIIIKKKINQFFEKIVSRKQVMSKNIRFFKKIGM